MCDPVTALSIGMAGLNYFSGQASADATINSNNQALTLKQEQIKEQQGQINQQSALDQSERIKQGMIERAKIATIAGESGALGISSDRLAADSLMQEGTDMSSMEKNRSTSIRQTQWDGIQSQAATNASNLKAEQSAPTLLSTGLQIGADAYTGYKKASAKAKSTTGVS